MKSDIYDGHKNVKYNMKYSGGKKNCIILSFSQQWDMSEVLVERLTMNACEIMQNLWNKHLTAGVR